MVIRSIANTFSRKTDFSQAFTSAGALLHLMCFAYSVYRVNMSKPHLILHRSKQKGFVSSSNVDHSSISSAFNGTFKGIHIQQESDLISCFIGFYWQCVIVFFSFNHLICLPDSQGYKGIQAFSNGKSTLLVNLK